MAQQFSNLSHIDLNQLLALQAILEERHVTRAAARASLSQPAMSRVLSRLRVALGDDLLVRSGMRYERTPRGDRLLQELEVLLPRLNAAIGGDDFDPSTTQQHFRVTGTDYAAAEAVRYESIDEVYADDQPWFASDTPDAFEQLSDAQTRDRLIAAIASLPEREQMVIQLYHVEELNLEEIGQVLGVGAARVCQIKSSAHARLKKAMTRG